MITEDITKIVTKRLTRKERMVFYAWVAAQTSEHMLPKSPFIGLPIDLGDE